MRYLLILALVACGGSADAPATPSNPSLVASNVGGADAPVAEYTGLYAGDKLIEPLAVAKMSKQQRVQARNEVYARHGRAFKNADLRAHFEAQPWYKVNDGYADSMLTANDKASAELIKGFEGDAPNLVEVGQLNGNVDVMFVDANKAIIMHGGAMYESAHDTVKWAAMGSYVVTWTGGDSFTASGVEDARLWKTDAPNHAINSVAFFK